MSGNLYVRAEVCLISGQNTTLFKEFLMRRCSLCPWASFSINFLWGAYQRVSFQRIRRQIQSLSWWRKLSIRAKSEKRVSLLWNQKKISYLNWPCSGGRQKFRAVSACKIAIEIVLRAQKLSQHNNLDGMQSFLESLWVKGYICSLKYFGSYCFQLRVLDKVL